MLQVQRSMIVLVVILLVGEPLVQAQQEVGFIERFAVADDRREVLGDLIPGTQDYFYFHCLYYQNEGEFAQAQAKLDSWRGKLGESSKTRGMLARQALLTYAENPQKTLDYLKRELGLNLNHAAPARDKAAQLPNELDNSRLDPAQLLQAVIANDKSLNQLEREGLWLLSERKLSVEQLRVYLKRIARPNIPGVVKRIAEELKLKDSRGFGWANIHQRLTLEQLDELLVLVPTLLRHDKFVRAYTSRLAPAEGESLLDKSVLREYLSRLNAWASRLPESQSSFKALVLGNLLKLDMSEGTYDRKRFLRYLALPRTAPYYSLRRFGNRRVVLADLNYTMHPHARLKRVGSDEVLVRRYLEHFLRSQPQYDDFAQYLDADYLERVRAETTILYGIGDAASAYGKLPPAHQKEIRDRVEVRFSPDNRSHFQPDESVVLSVEVKNVDQLIVKIYQINSLNYYRNNSKPLGTDVDLDGLVANAQKVFEFSQAAQLRHEEKIDLPELDGRGVWVVDLLGGGTRSRALIQKGSLSALQRQGDAGHVFQIVDEQGRSRPQAAIELQGKKFVAGDDGSIIVPYAEKSVTRNILLVDDQIAVQQKLLHSAEAYQLDAGFLIDRQALVAGSNATVAINARLSCNGRPISISLLESPRLTINATDRDGVSTSQTIAIEKLSDGSELEHEFLVPQRMTHVSFTFSGKVHNQSKGEWESVQASDAVNCNAIKATDQIADFFLVPTYEGFRLRVLGRNGEPIPQLPVTLNAKLKFFKNSRNFALATDQDGAIRLGQLDDVSRFSVQASGIRATTFYPTRFHRAWPQNLQIGQDSTVTLPLGKDLASLRSFSLYEKRLGNLFRDHSERIQLRQGQLTVTDLPPGDFVLEDYESRQRTNIIVGDAEEKNRFVAGKNRVLQASRNQGVAIRSAKLVDGNMIVEVTGADRMTRVHVVVDAFLPAIGSAAQVQLPYPALTFENRVRSHNYYVDSLRLDEEQSYILDRLSANKYPGNMLSQPSLLIHPWELSVTENDTKQAADGDALPASPAPAESMRRSRAEAEARDGSASPDWKSFDFLADGALLAINLGLTDGELTIPAELFGGGSHITIVVVHPTSVDSRHVVLPLSQLATRDQTLQSAFPADRHLLQTQKVEVLAAGEKKTLGDPRTRRLQTYGTIEGVYGLYSTLLGGAEWDKFRFVGQWHELTPEQRLVHYSEMACHELNFFLYHKDRQFFDAVVKPFIAQKLDKQLVDRWLLGEPVDQYAELWRYSRLNTFERILLAKTLNDDRVGTKRWLDDYLEANKVDPQWRRQQFEVALRGTSFDVAFGMMSGGGGYGGYGGGMGGGAQIAGSLEEKTRDFELNRGRGASPSRRALSELQKMKSVEMDFDGAVESEALMELSDDLFGVDRLGRAQQSHEFFRSLQKTRMWAETQFYKIRLQDQTTDLVGPSDFWKEYLAHANGEFLPENLDLPCTSVNEALLALAVIDLPLSADAAKITVEKNEMVVEADQPNILYTESIETAPEVQRTDDSASVLVGQEIYVANPGNSSPTQKPIGKAALVKGTAYVAKVVATNPGNEQLQVDVLAQLPQGAIALKGSKVTRSTPLVLGPYSTAQVEYSFYFPVAGSFEHYGAQVSDESGHLVDVPSSTLRVLEAPEDVDKKAWSYIADWGTNDEVLEFLRGANLEQIDLSRIAFRMKNLDFYRDTIELLSEAGRFHNELWAYAVQHDDRDSIEQLLQSRADILSRLGPVLKGPLLDLDPREQMSYEHLDFRPLVVARLHQLGPKRLILNPSLYEHYHQLLNVIAHQGSVSNDQKMQLCYYMLLQNRIEEALEWFSSVNAEALETQMQYSYFDAYLDFYRGNYDRAREIAGEYADYPVLRWRVLYNQIVQQVDTRDAIIAGNSPQVADEGDDVLVPEQKILTGGRETEQTRIAASAASLDIQEQGSGIEIGYRNLDSVQLNFYLMDIELLFSRKPFVSQGDNRVPAIEPNHTIDLSLNADSRTKKISLPAAIRNRNFLVEVTAQGLSRSIVVTANSLVTNLSEAFGQIHVTGQGDGNPVSGCYVKVYARHAGGDVRFYKDGYTDLRGYFDYASLSTPDLDTVERFSILVLDEKLGTVVVEAVPPTR